MKREKREILLPEIPTDVAKLIEDWQQKNIDLQTIMETYYHYYWSKKDENGYAINYLVCHPENFVTAYIYGYTTKERLKYKVITKRGEITFFEQKEELIEWKTRKNGGLPFEKCEAERIARIVDGEISIY